MTTSPATTENAFASMSAEWAAIKAAGRSTEKASALGTETWTNPTNLAANEYWTDGQSAIIFRLEGGKRCQVLAGYGDSGWKVGETHPLYFDQSGAFKGNAVVLGIVAADGSTTGEIPNAWLYLSVFK